MKYFLSLVSAFLSLAAFSQGTITTVAGGGGGTDGVIATNAALFLPSDVVADDSGNIYLVELTRIRKVSATSQIISTVVGTGASGAGCDSCVATQAKLNHASGIAFDKNGNMYIADHGSCRIRKVDKVTNIITTVAGNGTFGYSGDGGLATAAQLKKPVDVAIDSLGNLFIADEQFVIRKVNGQTGIISTIAGTGVSGTWNTGDTAATSAIGAIRGICVDRAGNIFFADGVNRRIGKISAAGILSVYCGTGTSGITGDGGLATNAQTYASRKLRLDKQDNLVFADGGTSIRRIDASGIISRIAGNGTAGFSGDGGPALQAQLFDAFSIWITKANIAYIADKGNQRIRKIENIVSVPAIINELRFSLYPNPTTGIATVSAPEPIRLIQIQNLNGALVYEKSIHANNTTIDLAAHPNGVYVVSVFTNERKASKQLIIFH